MDLVNTTLNDVKIIRPRMFRDDRGWFAEMFSARAFAAAGLPDRFVQDNESFSRRAVIRGLHYQVGEPQGKLVRVLSGHIWDVAVDIRPGSPQFGKWEGFDLTADKLDFLWIPEGFAHGFIVLSETANVFYKATRLYVPAAERCIRWNDPSLNITWPLDGVNAPVVSHRDAIGALLKDAELTGL